MIENLMDKWERENGQEAKVIMSILESERKQEDMVDMSQEYQQIYKMVYY